MSDMHPTLVCTGWESLQTSSIAETPCNMGPGTWSVASAAARSGSYGLRLNPTSSRSATALTRTGLVAGGYEVIGRVYVRFVSKPGTDWSVVYVSNTTPGTIIGVGIEYDASSDDFRAWMRNEATNTTYEGALAGISVATDTWYRLDFRITRPNGTSDQARSLEWYVDGASKTTMTQTTGLAVTSENAIVRCGEIPDRGNTGTYEAHIDDLVVCSLGTGDYPTFPIGEGAVYAQVPTSDGTHSNASSFTDNGGSSPPSSVYDRIDEVIGTSTTDYVGQTTIGGSDYVECNLTNAPDDWYPGRGAHGVMAWWAFAATATAQALIAEARWVTDAGYNGRQWDAFGAAGLNHYSDAFVYPGGSGVFSKSQVDAAVFRFGFSTDVTPITRVHQVLFEIAYPTYTPGAATEGWGVTLA